MATFSVTPAVRLASNCSTSSAPAWSSCLNMTWLWTCSPVRVATGEHVHNQVMFKQLLQAGALDVLQLDASRTAGVTENVAILLLAAKFGVPVCPHAGGVGLCEMVQHLAMFDYVAVSGSMENRVIEYVDHLHEHFTDPVRISNGRYLAPAAPGISAQMSPRSVADHRYPDGPVWSTCLL